MRWTEHAMTLRLLVGLVLFSAAAGGAFATGLNDTGITLLWRQ